MQSRELLQRPYFHPSINLHTTFLWVQLMNQLVYS